MSRPSAHDPGGPRAVATSRQGAALPAGKEMSIGNVAEQAGVSVATVSRVLNGHPNVRAETRDKVLAAVAASGYRVNELARNLRTAESRLLLTMVPDVGNPFYAEIVRGIDSVARQHGYFMLLCDTGADPGQVLGELAEFTHLVTKLKLAPGAPRDAALTEEEQRRGTEFASKLSIPVLTRTWQILLKGLQEVREAPRPLAAADMVHLRCPANLPMILAEFLRAT